MMLRFIREMTMQTLLFIYIARSIRCRRSSLSTGIVKAFVEMIVTAVFDEAILDDDENWLSLVIFFFCEFTLYMMGNGFRFNARDI